MSYRIEYQYAAFRARVRDTAAADRFIIAIEGGDNNLIDTASGKCARRWEVGMIGTSIQVLKRAVGVAGVCEDGLLKPLERDCTPENYIQRIRLLLDGPVAQAPAYWKPVLRVGIDHPALAEAKTLELPIREEIWFRQPEGVITFSMIDLERFFGFVDRYPDIPPWRFAEVGGLPSSLR